MRKFIIFLLISGLIISCGLINRNINEPAKTVEVTVDTLSLPCLYKKFKENGIKATREEISIIRYHSSSGELSNKYIYTKGNDTTYTVTLKDSVCIFTTEIIKTN